MSFAWPQLLWILVVPFGLLIWDLTHRRRAAAVAHPKILRAEAGPASLTLAPLPSPSALAPHLRARPWLAAGLALALFAMARPQWGRIEEPVFDQSREILLAIDLSRSMLATDVKPSRLDRSKLLIQSLLEKLAGERVGLVVFSGTAFLQAPLSADYEILREFLPALGPNFLPEGGTNYGAMLGTALQAFGATNSADRFLIVLSDGEATDTEWKARTAELKKKNIRVLGLGVGTAGGGMIPDTSGGLVKDERGAVVLSKLESATLQELATTTDGVYRDASRWIDVAALVNETIEAGRKGDFVEKNTVRLVERFQWPLALALWCLLVSFYYEFPVRPRVREVKLTPGARRQPAVAAALLILLLSPFSLLPSPALAAAKLAPQSRAPANAPAPSNTVAAPAPAEPPALAKIVGRLSAADHPTARDWAELGRETVTWGSRLQSQQQPVAEGPVRDALGAVDLGEKLDAKTTDWSKLREELEALLKKPDEDQQQQQKDKSDQPQDKDQKDNQKKQDQEKQDQPDQQQQKDQKQSQKGDDKSEKNSPSEKQDEKKDPGESAFGDMNKKEEPPPPPPENMQKVGGNQEQKEGEPREQMDPALALPMQKLEQLRNQDSPAHLFQLMEGGKKPAKKTGKDW